MFIVLYGINEDQERFHCVCLCERVSVCVMRAVDLLLAMAQGDAVVKAHLVLRETLDGTRVCV